MQFSRINAGYGLDLQALLLPAKLCSEALQTLACGKNVFGLDGQQYIAGVFSQGSGNQDAMRA
jgi:hypothetical protein